MALHINTTMVYFWHGGTWSCGFCLLFSKFCPSHKYGWGTPEGSQWSTNCSVQFLDFSDHLNSFMSLDSLVFTVRQSFVRQFISVWPLIVVRAVNSVRLWKILKITENAGQFSDSRPAKCRKTEETAYIVDMETSVSEPRTEVEQGKTGISFAEVYVVNSQST